MTDGVNVNCLSVVIPVFNEAEHLASRISQFKMVLDKLVGNPNWELVIVNNGSTDATVSVLEQIKSETSNFYDYFIPSPNYGKAIQYGIGETRYPWIYVVDLDQWDDAFIQWSWKYRYDYALITSSKRADPSLNRQSRVRFFLSWGLNAMLQLLFSFPGSDTHGQKLLNRNSLEKILKQTLADRGQYDVELVVRTLRSGKKMVELPVPYIEMRPSRNSLIKKVVWNCWALSKLAWRLRGMNYGSVELRRISRSDVENTRGFRYEGKVD